MVILLDQLDRDAADTFSLVLTSAGIGNRVAPIDGRYCLEVPEQLVDAARVAIHRFQTENPTLPDAAPTPPVASPSLPVSGIAVALVLLCVHLAVMASAAPEDYAAHFGADASRILDGELYRCATALVLHADAAHVVANMVAVAVFGGAVCALTGTGAGWLMILACGILGNLVNAGVHASRHLSIGASTAIFGSVGVLCAIQAVAALQTGRGWRKALMALGAGLALLAFLGASARADLGAHLFGFLCGLGVGVAFRLRLASRPGRRVQLVCGAIAVAVIVLAWGWGAANP